MRIGYGRVSTRDQHPEAQHDALRAAGCDQVFIDKASGKLARRPELDRALLSANRKGDQLVITKLDRLGRSLEHLIELSNDLQARGVDLVVLDQGIDTSTAVGRMFFQILGSIAEFEHALMSERTIDGLAAARARGRTGDQKPKLGARQATHAYEELGGREAALHRCPDRGRVRRHPPHHLPSPVQDRLATHHRGPTPTQGTKIERRRADLWHSGPPGWKEGNTRPRTPSIARVNAAML